MAATNARLEALTGAPRNSWLALDEEETKVVGSGSTLEEAVAKARDNGVNDPVVVWSPENWHHSVFRGVFDCKKI
jgi:hypothetical protein